MIIEDGRPLTEAALRVLEADKTALGLPDLHVQSVADFLAVANAQKLSRTDKETIVDQALLIVEQLYAHLPFKRSRYAIDPVQRLRLLRSQVGQIADVAFHTELVTTFIDLRDAHTFYGLPAPFAGAVAFLPFSVNSYHDDKGALRFIVTAVMDGFEHPQFKPEAEITCLNGVPIMNAVQGVGETDPGANPASRFARGLRSLTVQPLTFAIPPEQLAVLVQYIPCGCHQEERGILLPWNVGTGFGHQVFVDSASSVCGPLSETANARDVLWCRQQIYTNVRFKGPYAKPPASFSPETESALPQLLEFRLVDKFGYIRIKSFEHDSDEFFTEFVRILTVLQPKASNGLILDVRGNPGGSVQAAERILQLFTPQMITPAAFHFINTPLTVDIAEKLQNLPPGAALDALAELQPSIDDILDSVASGNILTTGKPLTDPDDANNTGQLYQGPVTLITDAISYSATDIFAGGFQDHAIGKIIGVDENTGGGGANRWLHDELISKLNSIPDLPLKAMPAGASLGFAVRRSSRVGPNAGNALEDVGVARDVEYLPTRNDVLNSDQDLIQFACKQLSTQPVYQLVITQAEVSNGQIKATVQSKNLARLECWVDGHPQNVLKAGPGPEQTITVPLDALSADPSELVIRGFALVADDDSDSGKSLVLAASARSAIAPQTVAASS